MIGDSDFRLSRDVCLISPIRDGEGFLASNVAHLRAQLQAIFKRVHIVIVESDSSDRTVDQCLHLRRNGLISQFFSLGSIADKHPFRSDRIAQARNFGLIQAQHYFRVDFYAFADLDQLNLSLTSSGIASCFRYDSWNGFLCNQRGRYYDIWALRHPVWCPSDCWSDYSRLSRSIGPRLARWMSVGARQIRIPVDSPPISVQSAFGGFGIYRADVCFPNWKGVDDSGRQVCEWVNFNKCIGEGLFINPAMTNEGPPEHYVSFDDEFYSSFNPTAAYKE